MIGFIKKSIRFLFPILIILIVVEILLQKMPNDYLIKKKYLDEHSNEVETLILGSSHSLYDLNPVYFSMKTFNAASLSQSLDYDFEILKKYDGKLKSLRFLIIPISYKNPFVKIGIGAESWRVKNYKLYWDIKLSNSVKDYSEVLNNRLDVNLKKIVSYYIGGKSPITCSDLGWGADYKSVNARDLIDTGKKAAKRHSVYDPGSANSQAILQENIDNLNAILVWCEEKDVKLFLLTPPAFVTYRQRLNAEQLKITLSMGKEMDLQSDNCSYLNFLSDSMFVASDYYDADHLSEIGAEKLSKVVDKQLMHSTVMASRVLN